MRQARLFIGIVVAIGLVLAAALPAGAKDNSIIPAHQALTAALGTKDFAAVWAKSHEIVKLAAHRHTASLTGTERYALAMAHYYLVAEELNLVLKVEGLDQDRALRATALRDRIMSAAPATPVATAPTTAPAGDVPTAVATPVQTISKGLQVTLTDYTVPGKRTIFDFFSEFCPPCQALSPKLDQLAQARPDLAVVKVDINRPGIEGIDWSSPVAQQYKIEGLPHLKVYGPDGKLLAEGGQAWKMVSDWGNGGQ